MQQIRADLFSTPYLLWTRAIIALKCERRLIFGCTYKAISARCKICFTPKSLSFSHKSHMNVPLSLLICGIQVYCLSRISYVICISYVISIVVISRSALNVLCLLLYPRNHWQHHVNKVKSSSCSSWIKTLLRLILLLVRWLHTICHDFHKSSHTISALLRSIYCSSVILITML